MLSVLRSFLTSTLCDEEMMQHYSVSLRVIFCGSEDSGGCFYISLLHNIEDMGIFGIVMKYLVGYVIAV